MPDKTTDKDFEEASQWINQYAKLNAELMQTALKSAVPLITAWANLYQGLLPQVKVTGKPASQPCCAIPETGCPPRDACTVHWDASAGERRTATLHIRNTSKDAITYTLSTKPFASGGKTSSVSPTVSPASIAAPAGETVQATVAVDVGNDFQPGSTWHAEVVVAGKYERYVKLELHMHREEHDTCRFDLGDIPYSKQPDQWYRHFQCSEPCFQPLAPPQQPTGGPVGVVVEPEG